MLVYYYCSLDEATELLTGGIPAKFTTGEDTGTTMARSFQETELGSLFSRNRSRTKSHNSVKEGIVFTTHLPHELRELETPFFEGERDVMLAISINARFLVPAINQEEEELSSSGTTEPSEGSKGPDVPYLWLVPSAVLSAMRSEYYGDVLDPQPWLDNKVLLPPHCIVRAYQLNDSQNKRGRSTTNVELLHRESRLTRVPSFHLTKQQGDSFVRDTPVSAAWKKKGIQRLAKVTDFHQEMTQVRGRCRALGLTPMYHFTSPASAAFIMQDGFRMSTQGQGDGGVYFSILGPGCYDIGSVDYEDNIIIDSFGVERLEEFRGAHKLDVCIVYAADPRALSPAPGGRENAMVVSKGTFTDLSLPHGDGSFFLRPDRIMRAFLIDPWDPPDGRGQAISQSAIEVEKAKDLQSKRKLAEIEKMVQENSKLASTSHFERLQPAKNSPNAEKRNSLEGAPATTKAGRRRSSLSLETFTRRVSVTQGGELFRRPSLDPASVDDRTAALKASIVLQRQRASKRMSSIGLPGSIPGATSALRKSESELSRPQNMPPPPKKAAAVLGVESTKAAAAAAAPKHSVLGVNFNRFIPCSLPPRVSFPDMISAPGGDGGDGGSGFDVTRNSVKSELRTSSTPMGSISLESTMPGENGDVCVDDIEMASIFQPEEDGMGIVTVNALAREPLSEIGESDGDDSD
jgi:hypothetical protein